MKTHALSSARSTSSAALVSLALVSLALVAGACTDEASDPGANEFRATGGGGSCSLCGFNTPHVNGYDVPELNLDFAPNADGVKLSGIRDPQGNLHYLDVEGDGLVARIDQTVTVSGADLVGWAIRVEVPGNVFHDLTIFAYDGQIASWATGADPISAYAIAYLDPVTDDLSHLCPESGTNIHDVSVTLIYGETYDAELKTVNPDMQRWVTLACEGNAVAKMKRMNYGPNSAFGGQGEPATVEQRQATLKMITADYCGDGTSYTEQGTAVHWQNAEMTVDGYPANPADAPDIEAYWGAEGALCLGKLRLAELSPGDIACGLPACDELWDPGYAEWTTWKPSL